MPLCARCPEILDKCQTDRDHIQNMYNHTEYKLQLLLEFPLGACSHGVLGQVPMVQGKGCIAGKHQHKVQNDDVLPCEVEYHQGNHLDN